MTLTTETPDIALTQVLDLFSEARHDEAWACLNQAALKFPRDARLRFLMGSILAGQERYEQALREFEFAVELDPGFEIARFQLGSLRFTSGDAAGARRAWQPFSSLPDGHPMKCFKNGCEALMEDRFDDTIQWLQQGIAANTENEHLNRDMQLLLDRTLELTQNNQANVASEGATHLLISGYQSNAPERQLLDMSVDPSQTKH